MMFRHWLCTLAVVPAISLVATYSAIAEIVTTLELMEQATRTRTDVKSAEIDVTAKILRLTFLDGKELSVSPDNLDLILDGLPTEKERQAAVDRFIDQLLASETHSTEFSAGTFDLLRPVVAHPDLERSVPDMPIWAKQMAPGLVQYLVIDAPNSVNYLTLQQIADNGTAITDLEARAKSNLSKNVDQVRLEEISAVPWIAAIVLDEFYECSLMILPDFWAKLSANHGAIGAACPSRGQLIVFDRNNPNAIATLQGYIEENYSGFPYPVSSNLYGWTAEGWMALD